MFLWKTKIIVYLESFFPGCTFHIFPAFVDPLSKLFLNLNSSRHNNLLERWKRGEKASPLTFCLVPSSKKRNTTQRALISDKKEKEPKRVQPLLKHQHHQFVVLEVTMRLAVFFSIWNGIRRYVHCTLCNCTNLHAKIY